MQLPDGRLIEYLHDPLGRRIAKKIDGAVVEKYLWQGLTRLLAVYDGADSLRMRFEYADGRMPVAMVKEGVLYYLCYDQVGSLRAVTDSAGNLVKTVAYDSFGYIIEDSNPGITIPFGFAGGLHDRDTGLVRFGYRDYDPDLGRWTAKDPIFFAGGDTDLYGYVQNDPVNLIDPTGEFAWVLPALFGGSEAAAGAAAGIGLGAGIAALWDWLWNENTEEGNDALDDYPANRDDWNPPDGWEETDACGKTGGKHRQWRGPDGQLRRWDREGREGGKERGPHWHDPRYPNQHIPPNR